jgi:hypothetical protein
MTQAEALVKSIRDYRLGMGKRPTYLEMQRWCISTSSWRRLDESGHKYLRKGEKLTRGKDAQGRVVFKIVRAK